ncbi:pyruvate dehydrogenase complex, E2 component, dihydrolipoamide acetyltransferase [Candidatus Moduliflexus flocculans]|uniref:Dihydrolipoamide acetyltransferase component of pyruvate dehydrogenase complex n=1 Tax=Candidatus Moduliflexus flocculans TaxID=1499966 RepID=A0A0S6VXB7_9BACT|nr:pyruvate dehydrogenase complex, E2 component, dihydrolipoamide acetyltransferase [Candidatus Moduliflexus flocculans]
MYEIVMPKLEQSMESGTITCWHKHEGDQINQGDVIFEVETEKMTIDVESPFSGYLRKIIRQVGEDVKVLELVAYLGALDENIPNDIANQNKQPETPMASEKKIPMMPVQKQPSERIRISPLARKICRELGLDYQTELIHGSAPGGRILKADVLAYLAQKQTAAAAQVVQKPPREDVGAVPASAAITIQSATPLAGIRKVIAQRMSLSKQTIPHIVLNATADATALIALREKLKTKVLGDIGLKLTYTDFLLKMCALALRKYRQINASLHDQTCLIYADINVGFAVAVGENLVVPTIYQCDRLSLAEIARKKQELIEKAHAGKLQFADISNGTFTLTNLGMFRVRSSSPIINPPQTAILAVGEIYQAPAVVNNTIGIRSLVELSLACDHRLIDGAAGAKFLQHIVELIEEPEMLML